MTTKEYTPSKKCSELQEEYIAENNDPYMGLNECWKLMEQLDQHYQGLQEQNQNLKVLVMSKDKEIASLKKEQEVQCIAFYDAEKRYKQEKLELLREIQERYTRNRGYITHEGSFISFIQNKIKEIEDKS